MARAENGLQLDNQYAEQLSLTLDLKILMRAAKTMIKRKFQGDRGHTNRSAL